MPKPVVDIELCIGCGVCPELCPAVFAMGDDLKAYVVGPTMQYGDCRAAVDGCPVQAITLNSRR
jgi:ferredoxin